MSNQLITIEHNERIKNLFSSLDNVTSSLEGLFIRRKPTFFGESFYTDSELSKMLKISRRSLQDYRNDRIFPFIRLGGKILYRSSDIEEVLKERRQENW